MAAAAKFMFNEDFADGVKPTITMVEHERRSADAESQAHRKGFEAGQVQARTEAGERVAKALTQIADSMERINQALVGIQAHHETEAVQVAVAVGAKLAPELIARQPLTEISALATECFRQLVTTPQISVRIGPDIYEAAKIKLEEIAQARGFEGRLIVQPDATVAPGDCHIEWAEGGIHRDWGVALAAVNEAVGRYVDARISEIE